jgi:dTDP-glucose pyrophosphorylase
MKAVILAAGKGARIFYFLSSESGYDFLLSGELGCSP